MSVASPKVWRKTVHGQKCILEYKIVYQLTKGVFFYLWLGQHYITTKNNLYLMIYCLTCFSNLFHVYNWIRDKYWNNYTLKTFLSTDSIEPKDCLHYRVCFPPILSFKTAFWVIIHYKEIKTDNCHFFPRACLCSVHFQSGDSVDVFILFYVVVIFRYHDGRVESHDIRWENLHSHRSSHSTTTTTTAATHHFFGEKRSTGNRPSVGPTTHLKLWRVSVCIGCDGIYVM